MKFSTLKVFPQEISLKGTFDAHASSFCKLTVALDLLDDVFFLVQQSRWVKVA